MVVKVYILSYDPDDNNYEIWGVYSSRELAEVARDTKIAEWNVVSNGHDHLQDFKIEEFEVQ